MEFRLDATKFYKTHCFHDNMYFDNPVIAYDIVKNDVPQRQMVIDSGELERAMREKKAADKARRPVVKHQPEQQHKKGELSKWTCTSMNCSTRLPDCRTARCSTCS